MYKFIFYLKDNKNIVITSKTNNTSIKDYVDKIADIMVGTELTKFETETDVLMLKPLDLMGVHIVLDTKSESSFTPIDYSEGIIDEPNLQAVIPDIDLSDVGVDVEKEAEETLDEFADTIDKIVETKIEPEVEVEANEEEIKEDPAEEEETDDNTSD